MKKRLGFTLIEVALFVALSGLILMGVIITTRNSINQQHYDDAVQNFADFLRGVYSEAANPKNVGDGRSEKAIYGKLVTFGEDGSEGKIYSYDILGNAEGNLVGGDVLSALSSLGASPIVITENNSKKTVGYAGFSETYQPTWDAEVNIATVTDNQIKQNTKGALMVVRSPMSGTLYTFTMVGATVEVQNAIKNQVMTSSGILNEFLKSSSDNKFTISEIDFCIKVPDADVFGNGLRDIRIYSNSHNSSGISVIDESAAVGTGTEENHCAKE